MKNRVTRLVLLACAAIAITPGVAGAQEVGFGVKGGFNLSTIAFDPSELEWGTRVGVVAGGFVALPLGPRFTIQPEGLFSQKGGTAELNDIEASIRLTYIEVPVLAKYAVWTGGGKSFSLFGGPSLAFKVSSDSSANVGGEDVDVDIDEDTETFDFGIAAGLEYAIGRFSIDARYTFALTDLNAAEDDDTIAKSRALAVMVGWRF